ncbi:hypothetical protein AZF01_21190 (plasmid) [Martelella sp. AD-3]|nr:hypothetical protein AZF01_21190 [Martelella sp. AD-3]MAM09364.1 hypothetical protein [Rhizobiaceae bacterium]
MTESDEAGKVEQKTRFLVQDANSVLRSISPDVIISPGRQGRRYRKTIATQSAHMMIFGGQQRW